MSEDKKEIDLSDILIHAGVKGMKWGKRKSKKETGISRFSSAKVEQNNNAISRIKGAQSGEKHKALAAVGRAMMGRQRLERAWDKNLKRLGSQNERLLAGKASVKDKLEILNSVTTAELFITRQS